MSGARRRSAAVVIEDGRLLVIGRRKDGREYAVLPGGGIEDGETEREACLRELREETGLEGVVVEELVTLSPGADSATYFRVRAQVEDLVLGGPELDRSSDANVYSPQWVPVEDVEGIGLVPESARAAVRNATGRRTTIILARHGEAAYPEGEDGGVLTEAGLEQARALAERMSDRGVDAVVSSELSRARQTAGIVAERVGREVQVLPGLHEYRSGDEPYSIPALGAALMAWLAGDLEARMLGGESGAEIVRRVLPVLEDLARRHEGGTVVVLMHGGAILATLGSIAPGRTGLPTGGDPYRLETDLAGGSDVTLEHASGTWSLPPR
ncbi:hypothetical protein CFK41_13555 [Brachybacterium ginsengisoli]|uniref:Nudix hydrolase domain-containing protein n=1 Tax=Brachybacterium ginsengisoli TaxID=1331682 RepID=A0A291GZP8_9MICO|nr:histidine phosphatase family protein [Brachybacterium ginsengisoli]ATG55683.1 hypothetical protein CFK41_13555 [Brachybacterium ginsengisoli]